MGRLFDTVYIIILVADDWGTVHLQVLRQGTAVEHIHHKQLSTANNNDRAQATPAFIRGVASVPV